MSNPSKRRGTQWEVDIRDFANRVLKHRTTAYRPAQDGHKDTGDIHGVSPFVLQAKNWRDTTSALRVGVDGAVKQAKHAGEKWGVAVVKRARKGVGEGYAVMRFEDWLGFYADYLDLLAERNRLRSRLAWMGDQNEQP